MCEYTYTAGHMVSSDSATVVAKASNHTGCSHTATHHASHSSGGCSAASNGGGHTACHCSQSRCCQPTCNQERGMLVHTCCKCACAVGYSKHQVEGSKLGLCIWKHVVHGSVKQWQSDSFSESIASDMCSCSSAEHMQEL
jgi:hypothetical protein